MNTSMKTLLASSIAAFALAGTAVSASAAEPAMPDQQMMMHGQAQGSGASGAMPGYGPGYGMGMMSGGMGAGYGMGPGMGMMGGGCPMGMMGGGMGPGMGMMNMMGGGMGGFGPGAGMMMGPGTMGGGMGPMAMLDLSDAQTAQLEKIHAESKQKQRTLMRQMWEEQDKLSDLYNVEKRDPATIGKAYGKLADLQRQALEARIEMENKMATVLTKEQKDKMRRGFGRGMMGY